MPVYRIKGWERFQHYKDRSPPWIRLHRSLLDDYDFHCLPDASRALAPMLWLLASDNKDPNSGMIDGPDEKIAFRLRLSVGDFRKAIKPLIDKQFAEYFHDASKPLAGCVPDATPETETDSTEADREREKPPDIDLKRLVEIWNETAGTVCPRVGKLIESRKQALRCRLADTFDRSVEKWHAYCALIQSSNFLTGNNDRNWKADFDWALKPQNIAKIMEGKYENNRNGNGRGGSNGFQGGGAEVPGGTHQPPSKWQTAAARVLDKIDRGEI